MAHRTIGHHRLESLPRAPRRQDLARIARELPEGETFYALFEGDSFWSFVTRNPGLGGEHCETLPDEGAPGVEYCRAKCLYAIRRGEIERVDEVNPEPPPPESWFGVPVVSVGRRDFVARR